MLERASQSMSEQWYVRSVDGTVTGPFQEREISADLIAGKIDDQQRVRQGATGEWCDAARARAVFQQLAEAGWYVRTNSETFGPFVESRLLELHRTGELAKGSEVRQGLIGNWRLAETVLSLWQHQKATLAPPPNGDEPSEPDVGRKWSVEPLRHIIMSVQGDDAEPMPHCQPMERLLLEYSTDRKGLVLVKRTNGQRIGSLSDNNSRQVIANAERGLSHVALLHEELDNTLEIALVLCPPGIAPEVCRRYVDQQFRQR